MIFFLGFNFHLHIVDEGLSFGLDTPDSCRFSFLLLNQGLITPGLPGEGN